MSPDMINLLVKSLGETCYMVLIAIVLATLIGLPLGVILTVTRKDHIMPNALVHNVRYPFHALYHPDGSHHSLYPYDRGLFHRNHGGNCSSDHYSGAFYRPGY